MNITMKSKIIALLNSANGLPLVFEESYINNEFTLSAYDSNKIRKDTATFPLRKRDKIKQIISANSGRIVSEEEYFKYPLTMDSKGNNPSKCEKKQLMEILRVELASGEQYSYVMDEIKTPDREFIINTIMNYKVGGFVITDDEGIYSHQTKFIESMSLCMEDI